MAAAAATRRNLRNSSRKASESAEALANMETKRTTRSVEATRRWRVKSGVRVLEKAEKNWSGDEDRDRRAESSFSFRL